MTKMTRLICAAVATAALFGTATAQEATNPAVKARISAMNLYAFNLGTLGAMAKGEMDYDAEAAGKAASNLVMLTKLDQSAMWPQGSDSVSDPSSRALPAIWENFPDVAAKGADLAKAAMEMEAAAGTDLASLQAAMGALGGACGACHKAYRAPKG